MVIIGGIGTLYGGVIGAAFLLTARTLLPDLKAWTAAIAPGLDLVQRLAERWLLYFGVLFILVVFFFPKGVLAEGRARDDSRPPGRAAVTPATAVGVGHEGCLRNGVRATPFAVAYTARPRVAWCSWAADWQRPGPRTTSRSTTSPVGVEGRC
jgi:hypothetical protein